jgi:hypothetical protein
VAHDGDHRSSLCEVHRVVDELLSAKIMMTSSARDWVMVTISPSFSSVLMSSPAPISKASPKSLTLAPLLILAGDSTPGAIFFFAAGRSASAKPC